jgi:ribosomal protein S18 acetylase RimI-like enzyme
LFRRDDVPPTEDGPITVRAPQQDEINSAVRMILSSDGHRPSDEHVVDFLRFVIARGVDINDLKLAEQNGRVQWAILPVVSPGRTMLLFGSTDRVREHEQRCAGRVINEVCAAFARRDIHLAQALVEPGNYPARRLFNQCGFSDLAELLYLQTTVRHVPPPSMPMGFSWETYSPATHGKFIQAIQQTYEESLDCPALTGLRSMEDVIASHKASGEFDPNHWFLLYEKQTPVAVLLLSEAPRSDAMELVYLGLTPAARGRGLGALALRKALWVTQEQEVSRLSCAVDAANVPALKLYYRHGMERVGSKQALIRDLRPLVRGKAPVASL